jgi:ketosteroid isomerase-like protein
VELVRALTAAANRVDIDAGAALLAPDVVWEENTELPGIKDVYRGRAEFRRWAEQMLEVFESPHQEFVRITELSGNRVFTESVLTAYGKGSGVPAELRYWTLYWLKNGRSRDIRSSGTGPRPSKPPGCGSKGVTPPKSGAVRLSRGRSCALGTPDYPPAVSATATSGTVRVSQSSVPPRCGRAEGVAESVRLLAGSHRRRLEPRHPRSGQARHSPKRGRVTSLPQ